MIGDPLGEPSPLLVSERFILMMLRAIDLNLSVVGEGARGASGAPNAGGVLSDGRKAKLGGRRPRDLGWG